MKGTLGVKTENKMGELLSILGDEELKELVNTVPVEDRLLILNFIRELAKDEIIFAVGLYQRQALCQKLQNFKDDENPQKKNVH